MNSMLQVVPTTLNGRVQEKPSVELDAFTVPNCGTVADEERESNDSEGGT